MPTIYLPERKERKKRQVDKSDNLIYKYVYNTKRWKDLRMLKLMECPTCECDECIANKKLKLALDVHHRIPIRSAGDDKFAIQRLGFDYYNLMSVNPDCHHRIHNKLKNKNPIERYLE